MVKKLFLAFALFLHVPSVNGANSVLELDEEGEDVGIRFVFDDKPVELDSFKFELFDQDWSDPFNWIQGAFNTNLFENEMKPVRNNSERIRRRISRDQTTPNTSSNSNEIDSLCNSRTRRIRRKNSQEKVNSGIATANTITCECDCDEDGDNASDSEYSTSSDNESSTTIDSECESVESVAVGEKRKIKRSKVKESISIKANQRTTEELEWAITQIIHSSLLPNFDRRNAELKLKLIGLFKIQHPNSNFNLREFNVQNWPEGIEILKHKWNLEELEKIELSIDKFVYVPREARSSIEVQHGLDKLGDLEGILIHDWEYKSVKKRIFERFKSETRNFNVCRIKWSLLDYTHIPIKYKGIIFNALSFNSYLVYKNPEIIENIHFIPPDTVEIISVTEDSDEAYEEDKKPSNSRKTVKIVRTEGSGLSTRAESKLIGNFLKAKFKLQFPNEKYEIRKFEVINWPKEIKLCKTHWTVPELAVIRENMEAFVFKKRDVKYSLLEEYGIEDVGDSEDVLMKDWTQIDTRLFILERYRIETNNPDANSPDYTKLNRSEIPEKYRNYTITGKSMQIAKLYKNPLILNNIHFCEKNSEGKYPHSTDFVPMVSDGKSMRKPSKAMATRAILLERFKLETGDLNAETINYSLLDRRSIPSEFDDWIINASSMASPKFYNNVEIVDNIHFFKDDSNNKINDSLESIKKKRSRSSQKMNLEINELDVAESSPKRTCIPIKNDHDEKIKDDRDENISETPNESKKKVRNQRLALENLNKDLIEIFSVQHPGKKYNLRNYDVQNWPEGIDLICSYRSISEIGKIRDKLSQLIFVERSKPLTREMQLGLDGIRDSNVKLMKTWTATFVRKRLLDRFKEETGLFEATQIDYSYLNRSQIPSEYDLLPINGETMGILRFYKNPLIIDNIHFYQEKPIKVKLEKSQLEIKTENL